MGWVFRYVDQHQCELPKLRDPDIRPRDMWRCDECGVYWEVKEDSRGEKYFHRHGVGSRVAEVLET